MIEKKMFYPKLILFLFRIIHTELNSDKSKITCTTIKGSLFSNKFCNWNILLWSRKYFILMFKVYFSARTNFVFTKIWCTNFFMVNNYIYKLVMEDWLLAFVPCYCHVKVTCIILFLLLYSFIPSFIKDALLCMYFSAWYCKTEKKKKKLCYEKTWWKHRTLDCGAF